jgi:phosphoribosylamine---glycine ligase
MVNRVENYMVVGSGGREHALVWKLRQSPHVGKIVTAPGNVGTYDPDNNMENIDIDAKDITRLAAYARDNKIGHTIVGPEDPLALGIVNLFQEDNLSIFGPTQEAAVLESQKAETTEFMQKHNIPHPESKIFSNYEDACAYVSKQGAKNIVIKASGLAQGKGVYLPDSYEEAEKDLSKLINEKDLKGAGETVVIQERLIGREISILSLSDGKHVIPFLPAQDHKRAYDGDKGPNTGGMGAYAPVPFVTPELFAEIQSTILQPTIDGMESEGRPFKGVLYAGLMLTVKGPKVLEFNVRFGDPEIQPLLRLFEKDLAVAIMASIEGKLKPEHVSFHKGAAACLVLASEGYPGKYEGGKVIEGLNTQDDPNVVIFQAGTAMKNGKLVTHGGRVLDITAYGRDILDALRRAYRTIGPVRFDGMQYRTDIGRQAIK